MRTKFLEPFFKTALARTFVAVGLALDPVSGGFRLYPGHGQLHSKLPKVMEAEVTNLQELFGQCGLAEKEALNPDDSDDMMLISRTLRSGLLLWRRPRSAPHCNGR